MVGRFLSFIRPSMERVKTSKSTPETRRKEILLSKSSSINEKIEFAFSEAKSFVRQSFAEQQQRSSKQSQASNYHVELPVDSDDENDKLHFVSCLNIEPNYKWIPISSHRRRTSSVPNSSIVIDLSRENSKLNQRTSSLNAFNSWQYHPERVINLVDRLYHCQPICSLNDDRFALANSRFIDLYHLETGSRDEEISFHSMNINCVGLCYNNYRKELLIASKDELFVYNPNQRKVRCQFFLPGYPFDLDLNHQIRYLSCNSSSIFHGYFAYSSTSTKTVLSRLSQFQFLPMSDLEFNDGTLHGLCALESSIGIVIRYGRYSSKSPEQFALFIYDGSLSHQFYRFDLNDVGLITGLTASRRTFDWILSDYQKKRLIFVNEESIETVEFHEEILQCSMFEQSKIFAVWVRNRVFLYRID